MEQIRFVTAGDAAAMEQMRAVWKQCFGADEAYLQLYFSTRYRPDQTLAFFDDGQLLGMLTLLPCTYRGRWQGKERIYRGCYLFAVGTLPAAQGRQIATKLLSAADEWMRRTGIEVALLAPAEDSLYSFYQKRGYEHWFAREKRVFPALQSSADAQGLVLVPLDEQEYWRHHRRLLPQDSVLWPEEALPFAAGESRLYGGGIYALTRKGKRCGICYLYRYTPELVIIKELLAEPGEDPDAMIRALRGLFAQSALEVRLAVQTDRKASWAGMAKFYLAQQQRPEYTGRSYLPFILD